MKTHANAIRIPGFAGVAVVLAIAGLTACGGRNASGADDVVGREDAVVQDGLDPDTGATDSFADPGIDTRGDSGAGLDDDLIGEVAGDAVDVAGGDAGSNDVLDAAADPGAIDAAADMHDAGPAPRPMISEFMAQNRDTIEDEDGESSDWIEIYNPTAETINLSGYHLTDDRNRLTRWTFPVVYLPAGGYVVVFASGKDRREPGGELHTNFKLSGGGEDLVLASPEGDVVQSFLDFPAGIDDVSYGPAVTVERTDLVMTGDAAQVHVPVSGPPPAEWADTDFVASEPEWISAFIGAGYDLSLVLDPPVSGDELGVPTADSIVAWTSSPGQNVGGWVYGYYDRSADDDHSYSGVEFTQFPRDGHGYSATDFWNGSHYDWFQGDPPWTWMGSQSVHPNGENNGPEHWVIRRYQAQQSGPYFVEWHIAKKVAGGTGVTGYVYHQGTLVDQVVVDGADLVGPTRALILPYVHAGDFVDFAIGPAGPDGLSDDTSDMSNLSGALWNLPDMADEIATDVGAAMSGVSAGMFMRVGFEVEAAPMNRLVLKMKYDDGFEAFVNGQPVASANAPAQAAWDATAYTRRPLSAVKTVETFNISGEILDIDGGDGLLRSGANVLAIHGMNSAVDDPTFLVAPELEGRYVTYDDGSRRHYSVPTPGADNDDGPVVPVLQHLTPATGILPWEPVAVSARLWFADAPVDGATLTYRVMFGPETTIPMTGDGTGLFTAAIPGGIATSGDMIRWFIQATDESGQTVRAPAFYDPLDSEEYFGTVVAPQAVVSNLPVFHLFVENLEAAATRTGTRGALYFGSEFYDNVRIDLHGQSTAGFPKKSYDIDFNRDHRFLLSTRYKRMKDINLLSNWADKSKLRNTLAYEVWRDSGSAYHLAFPVRVQMNGAFFEVGDFVEDGDDHYLERLGLDPEGALYKEYDGLYDVAYGEKKTRKDEDKSDLQALISGLDRTGDDLRNFLYDNVNVPAMANFLAAMIITATTDCCHKNFYAYRDTNGTGEWWYLPWDVDLTFGRNWISTLTYFDDTMHPQNPLYIGASKLTNALFALPEFQEMYLRRLRTLMDRIMQPPGTAPADLAFERRIDELVGTIGEDGRLDYEVWPKWGEDQTMEEAAEIMKTEFLAPRREYLFVTKTADGTIPAAQGAPTVEFGGGEIGGAFGESWVTIRNPGENSVDMSGWQVIGDVSMTMQPGTVLPAGGTIFLVEDAVGFRARQTAPTGGMGLLVQGNWSGVATPGMKLMVIDTDGRAVASGWF